MSKINVIKRRTRTEPVEVKSGLSIAGLSDETAEELENAIAELTDSKESKDPAVNYRELVISLGKLDRATRKRVIRAADHFAKAEAVVNKLVGNKELLEDW